MEASVFERFAGIDRLYGLGAATHVTGAFAFAAAGKALEMLLKRHIAA